jgi:hypothetical protein
MEPEEIQGTYEFIKYNERMQERERKEREAELEKKRGEFE